MRHNPLAKALYYYEMGRTPTPKWGVLDPVMKKVWEARAFNLINSAKEHNIEISTVVKEK